ncbi:hypothetical protein Nos7524_3350 [Nostoc sp. PCC 7524]|jgi:hypothetical protein|nr:hypothetical protein Nos7524_3350 [Nostoc sp. PCC 7524]
MFLQNSSFTKNTCLTNKKKNLNRAGNAVLYCGLSITLMACTVATVTAIYPFLISCLAATNDTSFQATSIPWLDNQSSCQETGRNWHENKCWDEEHSPTF